MDLNEEFDGNLVIFLFGVLNVEFERESESISIIELESKPSRLLTKDCGEEMGSSSEKEAGMFGDELLDKFSEGYIVGELYADLPDFSGDLVEEIYADLPDFSGDLVEEIYADLPDFSRDLVGELCSDLIVELCGESIIECCSELVETSLFSFMQSTSSIKSVIISP